MRIEEQNKGRYNKYPNQIESSLIRILNRYFNNVTSKDLNLVDAIIDEVLRKVKEEIGVGVSTVSLDSTNNNVQYNINIPKLLLKKDLTIFPGENIEYVTDVNQLISYIEIADGSKTYKHVGGYGQYLINDSIILIEMYHDNNENREVINIKNSGSNSSDIKIIIYS